MDSTDKKTPKLPIFKKRLNILAEAYPNKTEFAKLLGYSQQTVNYWLNGDRVPDASYLIQIAEKTGVSIDWLLGISDSQTPKAEIKAMCDYTGLSDAAINSLHGEIDSSDIASDKRKEYEDFAQELLISKREITNFLLCTLQGQFLLEMLHRYFHVHLEDVSIKIPEDIIFSADKQMINILYLEQIKDAIRDIKKVFDDIRGDSNA